MHKNEPQQFLRTPDSYFYESPRFVTHIDGPAIAALTKFYSDLFPPTNTPGVSMLDICSSWVRPFLELEVLQFSSAVFMDYVKKEVCNLPLLSFVCRSVIFQSRRLLTSSATLSISFSNRCFFTKAISIWTSTGDADHIMIVGSYFHYAGGFEPPKAVDISPNPGRSDPMYIVYSRKLSTA